MDQIDQINQINQINRLLAPALLQVCPPSPEFR